MEHQAIPTYAQLSSIELIPSHVSDFKPRARRQSLTSPSHKDLPFTMTTKSHQDYDSKNWHDKRSEHRLKSKRTIEQDMHSIVIRASHSRFKGVGKYASGAILVKKRLQKQTK